MAPGLPATSMLEPCGSNDWAKVYDEFEEGGFKPSGQGRMNSLTVLDDFVEYKHITINTGAIPRG